MNTVLVGEERTEISSFLCPVSVLLTLLRRKGSRDVLGCQRLSQRSKMDSIFWHLFWLHQLWLLLIPPFSLLLPPFFSSLSFFSVSLLFHSYSLQFAAFTKQTKAFGLEHSISLIWILIKLGRKINEDSFGEGLQRTWRCGANVVCIWI